jgi:hypothetical protein
MGETTCVSATCSQQQAPGSQYCPAHSRNRAKTPQSAKVEATTQLLGLGSAGLVLLILGFVVAVQAKPTTPRESSQGYYLGCVMAGLGSAMLVVVLVAVGTILGRRAGPQ